MELTEGIDICAGTEVGIVGFRVRNRITGEYATTEDETNVVLPVTDAGTPYAIELRNNCPYADADVELFVDGIRVGSYRVSAQTWFSIERGRKETRGFAFHSETSDAALAAGKVPGAVTNGMIRAVWSVEKVDHTSQMLKTSDGWFQKQMRDLPLSDKDSTIEDVLACSRHHIQVPYPISRIRYCDSRGVSLNTAETNQRFGQIAALTAVLEPVTIECRLVGAAAIQPEMQVLL